MNTAMYALNGFSGTVNCKITDLSGAGVRDILVNRTFNSSNPITFGTPPSFTLTETGDYYIEFQATHNSAFALVPGNPHLAATFISIIQMARTVTLTARDQTMAYRYGFNGKMNLNDLAGLGMMQDYGFRMSMAGRGRFMSVDPLREKYPELTPYQFASNSPFANVDLDGLENHLATDGHLLGAGPLSGSTLIKLNNEYNVSQGLNFTSSPIKFAPPSVRLPLPSTSQLGSSNPKQAFVGPSTQKPAKKSLELPAYVSPAIDVATSGVGMAAGVVMMGAGAATVELFGAGIPVAVLGAGTYTTSTVSFGLSLGKLSDAIKNPDNPQNIPGGLLETGGMAVDKITKNPKGTNQLIGAWGDFGVGVGLGKTGGSFKLPTTLEVASKTGDLIQFGKLATETSKIADQPKTNK